MAVLVIIEDPLGQLDQQMADLLTAHHDAGQRLAEIPGPGVDSEEQIIAEVGATAATFPSSKHLAILDGRLSRQRSSDLEDFSPGRHDRERLSTLALTAA